MDFSFHYKTFKRTIEAVWFFFLNLLVIIKLIGAYNFFYYRFVLL
jgi:hypothetical protein